MKHYFKLENSGIAWDIKQEDWGHFDDFEFSGRNVDCIVFYTCDFDGTLVLNRFNAFPSLRVVPNNTHGTACNMYEDKEKLIKITANGSEFSEYLKRVEINGIVSIISEAECGLKIRRTFIPGETEMMMCEVVEITNISDAAVDVAVSNAGVYRYNRGTNAVYIHEIVHTAKDAALKPEESMEFCIYYHTRRNELVYQPDGKTKIELDVSKLDWKRELKARQDRLNEFAESAKLETGNELLDTMYRFCKTRAGESIFATKGGVFHSPGGISYYAATWCNDQAEYAGPWLAFTNDAVGVEASVNAYKHYMPFMTDEYIAIPSSIIAQGEDRWGGGDFDRGDAAMYLYGGSLFVLTNGDRKVMESVWPGIKWCAEYCKRKTLPEGVVFSVTDELEGRFGTDERANLSTSSLAYGGFKYAAMVAEYMGESELACEYRAQADIIEKGIESHFGANLHGFETYRYSAGFDTLRAWICLPMCMGIDKRMEGTLDAMFSDYLWTGDGMLSCEYGEENKSMTTWDRATLYGFKGAFMNGKFGNVWDWFMEYCNNRMTGERVPYAIEAWPEGGKRHLSGESALFCRIIPEGVLAIKPESMRSFSFIPRIPEGLEYVKLSNFRMCGDDVSITVTRDGYTVEGTHNKISGAVLGERVIFETEMA